MSAPNYKRTRLACFTSYLTMASVFCVPPILFVTLREMYGVSYTLLGTLVLINFITQLSIDLIFTFFAKHFNPKVMVRVMPLVTSLGLFIYAFIPSVAPDLAYLGLVIGTVIFSAASGFCEVLISPVIAALPAEDPDREMSKLHSIYAWGVVFVIVVSTLFLLLIGDESWQWLALGFALIPVLSAFLFFGSEIPAMETPKQTSDVGKLLKNKGIWLSVFAIFLGGAAENTMTNWISVYMERALQIPKALGDTLGLVSFALLLALARSLYAKYGKKIFPVLLTGMTGALGCYLLAGLSSNLIVAMVACMLTGICTSMLWPGTLILMEEEFPNPGVAAYALMAAGGDFGASVAPQGLGIVADTVAASQQAVLLGEKIGLSPEQIGIKAGMLVAAVFPLLGIGMLLLLKRFLAKKA